MKRFQVENRVGNEAQCAGEEPWENISYDFVGDYIEAETPEDAIIIAINYLTDVMQENIEKGEYIEWTRDDISIYNENDVKIKYYFDFTAKDVDEY